jgi:hypothetical protein
MHRSLASGGVLARSPAGATAAWASWVNGAPTWLDSGHTARDSASRIELSINAHGTVAAFDAPFSHRVYRNLTYRTLIMGTMLIYAEPCGLPVEARA